MIEATWDSVLRGTEADREWHNVCFAGLPITGSESVALTIEDEWEPDDDDVPAPAAVAGMTASLDRGQLEGIIANLVQQVPNPTTHQTYEAIRYYYERDAFIRL